MTNDFRFAATMVARIARMAAVAIMKAAARIGEVMVIGFPSLQALQDRGDVMGQPDRQFLPLLWQRHQDLSPMTKL
ncbi:hypothetical protein [Mesorhizobium intechi]|uniref:hypothetical protein n=1 Tax=Mesorhizobium intechi TaxID=537601 RepID=UPI00142EAE2F|nr:hypothetical protein [Mesorhizobium intechi]